MTRLNSPKTPDPYSPLNPAGANISDQGRPIKLAEGKAIKEVLA